MTNLILLALAAGLFLVVARHLSWHKASFANTLVRDGDSIRITGTKATVECRLDGYDAPEWNQPHGAEATRALKALLKDGYRWKAIGTDSYGRIVINVRNAKGSVGRQMVLSGNAHNSSRWGLCEFIARLTRRGLWTNRQAIHPATFRAITPKNAR